MSRPGFDPDERTIVWQAIESLAWRQGPTTLLRYCEDLPQSEIADLLHRSTGAVGSLLTHAITTLRTRVAEEEVR